MENMPSHGQILGVRKMNKTGIITFEHRVICDYCGELLNSRLDSDMDIIVKPCVTCIREAIKEAIDENLQEIKKAMDENL
jgi:hypothetical protein